MIKNILPAKLIALFFLFSAIPFLPSAKAQSQSTLPKLEGTAWRVTTTDWYPIKDIPIIYGFGEQGRADVIALVTYVSVTELPYLYYDRSRDSWKVEPGDMQSNSGAIQHTGRYKQNRTSIHLEFKDHIIDATIKGNQMEGEIKSTKGDPRAVRARWSAERVIIKSQTSSDAGRKEVTKSVAGNSGDRGVAIAGDLDNSRNTFLLTYEADVSGTFKIGEFSGEERGLLKIEMDIRNMDALKANFAFNSMSGNLSGKIYDNERLQLQGVGVLKGTLSENKYQCSVAALVRGGNLTDGKIRCESGSNMIEGAFNTASRK